MTPTQVKANLAKQGKTLRQHCEEININYRTAQSVLNGIGRGKYGESHRAAVALGLKEAA
ncbi:MAG: DNA-binding protein [Methylotenera sp.]|nr:DNA-binding protein [Methylotenera sp.]